MENWSSKRQIVKKHFRIAAALPVLYRKETDGEGYWAHISWVFYCHYQQAILPSL